MGFYRIMVGDIRDILVGIGNDFEIGSFCKSGIVDIVDNLTLGLSPVVE